MENKFDETVKISLKNTSSTDNIPLKPGKSYCIVINSKGITIDNILMEDALFNSDSAVLFPEGMLIDPNNAQLSGQKQGLFGGLKMLAHVVDFLMSPQNEERKLFVAGHTDSTDDNDHNRVLSRLRANSVYYLLTNDRDKWVDTIELCNNPIDKKMTPQKKGYRNQDIRLILTWCSSPGGYGWDCDPESIGDEELGPKDRKAITNFRNAFEMKFPGKYQKSHNGEQYWGWKYKNEDPGWGAVFDLYQEKLVEMITAKYCHKESEWRQRINTALDWTAEGDPSPDGPFTSVGCGEERPIDYPITTSDGDDNKSLKNRRVEVLFFQPEDLPQKLPCHGEDCLTTTCQDKSETSLCPLGKSTTVNMIYLHEQTWPFSFHLYHDRQPLTDIPCMLSYTATAADPTSGEEKQSGFEQEFTTDGNGVLFAELPMKIHSGTIRATFTVNETGEDITIEVPLRFNELEPADSDSGARQRLGMLGYYSEQERIEELQNPDDDSKEQNIEEMAIKRLQDTHFLTITGELNDDTISAIEDEFLQKPDTTLQIRSSDITNLEDDQTEEAPADSPFTGKKTDTAADAQIREPAFLSTEDDCFYGISHNFSSDRVLFYEKSKLTYEKNGSKGAPRYIPVENGNTLADVQEIIEELRRDIIEEFNELLESNQFEDLRDYIQEIYDGDERDHMLSGYGSVEERTRQFIEFEDSGDDELTPGMLVKELSQLVDKVFDDASGIESNIRRRRCQRVCRRIYRRNITKIYELIHERFGTLNHDFDANYRMVDEKTGNDVEGLRTDDIAVPSVRNGYYQQIVWLGVSSYMIINHHDKEIVLVDPWPSYCSIYTTEAFLFPDFTYEGALAAYPTDQHDEHGRERYRYRLEPSPDEIMQGSSSDEIIGHIQNGVKRLVELANFIRKSVADGYRLTGILLSHFHYDHADDIPYLLELLHAESGSYTNHVDLVFSNEGSSTFPGLEGQKLEADDLPVIYTDFDAMYLMNTIFFSESFPNNMELHGEIYDRFCKDVYFDGNSWHKNLFRRKYILDNFDTVAHDDLNPDPLYSNWNCETWQSIKNIYGLSDYNTAASWKWHEITTDDNIRLYYDDSVNLHLCEQSSPGTNTYEPLLCGMKLKTFNIGGFRIVPYVADHNNTGPQWKNDIDVGEQQNAGNCQRITAFNVEYRYTPGAKKTYVNGSSGEMNATYTRPLAPVADVVETDVLVGAVAGETFNNIDQYDGRLKTWLENVFDFFLPDNSEKMRYCWDFVVNHLEVRDFIIATHWEDFPTVAPDQFIIKQFSNFGIVMQNIGMLTEKYASNSAGLWDSNNPLEKQTFFILGRMGNGFVHSIESETQYRNGEQFEYALPYNAGKLLNHHYKRGFDVEMKSSN